MDRYIDSIYELFGCLFRVFLFILQDSFLHKLMLDLDKDIESEKKKRLTGDNVFLLDTTGNLFQNASKAVDNSHARAALISKLESMEAVGETALLDVSK